MNLHSTCSIDSEHSFDFSANKILWVDDHVHTELENEFSERVKNIFQEYGIPIAKEEDFRQHLNLFEVMKVISFFTYLNVQHILMTLYNLVAYYVNTYCTNIVSYKLTPYDNHLRFPVLYPCWGRKYIVPSNTVIFFTGIPMENFFERLYKFRKIVAVIEVPEDDLQNPDSVFQHNFNIDHILKGFMSWIGVSSNRKFRMYSINGCSRVYDWDELDSIKLDMMTKFFSRPKVPRHTDFVTEFKHPENVTVPEYLKDYYYNMSRVLTDKQLLPIKRDICYFGCNLITYTAKKFLCDRNGMSYGFLAYQLPVELGNISEVQNVIEFEEAERNYGFIGTKFYFSMGGKIYKIDMPDIYIATTRSGCDKSNIDSNNDLILYNINEFNITQYIPNKKTLCQPSFDIWLILIQSICNTIIASVLNHFNPNHPYTRIANDKGLMIVHVHGFPRKDALNDDLLVFGHNNPSITCGCPESAYYCYHDQLGEFFQKLPEYIDNYSGSLFLEKDHGVVYTTGYRETRSEIAELFESYEYGEKNFIEFPNKENRVESEGVE